MKGTIKIIIGRLKEKLVLETDTELIVIPAGVVVEVSSEEEYPHEISDDQMEDAAKYLSEN